MNKVYQHGDELFVTFDATPRMRNLRTGLTITPRVPFKYLGEMPQVGQVWALRSPCKSRFTVTKVSGGDVTLDHPVFLVEITRLTELYKSFELVHPNKDALTEPNYHFATGHKGPLNAKATGRRFTVGEPPTDEVNWAKRADDFKKYCMADVEASDSLVICRNGDCYLVYKKGPAKCPHCCGKKLPIPGQLWAKGSRYVTVDRVEDGRVYYTDGASGLRRFLNEYAHMSELVDYRRIKPAQFGTPDVVDAAKMFVSGFNPPEFGTAFMFPPRPFLRPLCKPGHDRQKVEELARGYNFGKQGLKDFGAQVQRYGRILRPTPTTGGMPCPLNTSTLSRLNTGNALDNWTQYRNTLGAKIRYANQRVKELSK